jgi:hypothetical protein
LKQQSVYTTWWWRRNIAVYLFPGAILWQADAVEAFRNLFIPRDKGVQDQRCIERQSYQSTDEKSAQ